jgi:short-subunit dehydrogenase
VNSQESLEKGFAELVKDFDGKFDICLPCAGINHNLFIVENSFEEHHRLICVNVVGIYHTAQLAAEQMLTNGTKKGSIILVANIARYIATRSQKCSAHGATKGAVRAIVPAIAAELAKL